MATATHTGEEIEVTFTARMVKTDYGVERSPVWYEPEDIAIDEVVILGTAVDHTKFPEKVLTDLMDLADDLEFEE